MRHTKVLAIGLTVLPALILAIGCCTPVTTGLAAPSVVLITPTAASTAACPNTAVTASFSQTMNPATINSSTFTLGTGGATVAGVVAYNATSNTASLTPTALLIAGATYTVTITTGARNTYGTALAANVTSSFTVAANGCNPPPVVAAVTPLASSTTACPNATVSVTFNEAMNPATVNATTFTLATGVTGTISHNAANTTFTLTPSTPLLAGTTYTGRVSQGALDTFGNSLVAAYSWTFLTAANGCNPPPAVLAVTPIAGSTTTCPNGTVTATFSEAMNPASINAASFTLSPGVVGTVSHDVTNRIFTLTPSANLSAGKVYTGQISTAAQDTFGNFLPVAFVWTFTTAANGCNPPPTVTAVTPAPNAVAVCPNSVITATFNGPMSPLTLNTATFLLTGPGTTAVTGVVSYNATTDQAIFAPATALALNTTYTATLTTGAQSLAGVGLAANYVWSFTTGPSSCLPPAPPISVTPAAGSIGICNNTVVAATFTEVINPATVNALTFTLTGPGLTPVAGVVTANTADKVFTFTPSVALALSTTYTATLTTGVQDPFGNALASNYTWTFTTGATSCTAIPPAVVAVTPLAGAIGTCSNSLVTATFSEAMDPTTLTTASFFLAPTAAGTVTMDSTDKIATLTPSANLALSTLYTATITTAAKDTSGNSLVAPYTWSFTTGNQICQPPVALGTAANFVVLAASTVTSTGPTVISGGNLGLSPGTAVTGFPPGVLIAPAIMDITDPIAAQAELDLTTAYNYTAGLPGGASLPTDLTGLTFTPGLYKATTSTQISSGNLTLDAQGNPNAVFIFQVASTLTTLGTTQVVLAGGAQAKNVFWQVGSSATLGTNSIFEGTIMALTSVTLDTGATLTGRALALNGAVTLDTNIVTAP